MGMTGVRARSAESATAGSSAPSPPAVRLSRRGWRGGRAATGAALVLLAALLGARAVTLARSRTEVLAVAQALPAGHVLAAGDLLAVAVHLSTAQSGVYWPAADGPGLVGHVVEVPLPAGALLGRSVVSLGAAPEPLRVVSVPVDPGRFAAQQPGQLVDVYATYKANGTVSAFTEMVVQGAVFLGVGGSTISGAEAIRLLVAPSQAAALVQASELASLDIVGEQPAGLDTGQTATTPPPLLAPQPSGGAPPATTGAG